MPRGILLEVDLQRIFDGRGPTRIFDVGANVGWVSLSHHKAFPLAELHAFEPVRRTYEQLEANLRNVPHTHCHCIALGNFDGTAAMQLMSNPVWNRVVEPGKIEQGCGSEIVQIARLDTFCREHQLEPPDFLKTDCEGYDLEVLHGIGEWLNSGRIRAIYCEVNFRRDGVHADFYQLEEFLSKAGYIVYGFYDYSGWQAPVSYDGFTNALFVHRSTWP